MSRRQRRAQQQQQEREKRKSKEIRVGIGTPSTDTTYGDFGFSLARMLYVMKEQHPRIKPLLLNKSVQPVDRSRNEIVMHAYEAECKYVFFHDSDHVTPPSVIPRLISHDRMIIGCNYPRRNDDLQPTTMSLSEGLLKAKQQGVIKVAGIPTGCLLVRMEVFARLSYPWFKFELVDNEYTRIHPFDLKPGEYWEHFRTISEDYYFCNKAREAGYNIWCDTDLSQDIIHIGKKYYRFPEENGTNNS